MKARMNVMCECCKAPVPTGTQVTRYAGRLWLTDHLIRYKQEREEKRVRRH